MVNKSFTLAGQDILAGTKKTILFPAPSMNTQIKMDIPIHVFHGRQVGPKIFVIGTMHGDEVNSIEIIRRVHNRIDLKKLCGTLITVPVANFYGLIMQMRYLPDRRDLNRSFPGTKKGSLATRLAYGIMQQVVAHCDYGIDLHTGALGRINMPQLRVNLDTPGARKLALAFNTPVILDAKLRDGSLRQAASELGIPLLVYEGGEALRFNELCIRSGTLGILNVLDHLKMLPLRKKKMVRYKPIISNASRWVRAQASGFVEPITNVLSKAVKKGDVLACIHDPFLINPSIDVLAPFNGIVIGQNLKPLVSEGDALYNIASFKKISGISASIEEYRDDITNKFDHY